MGPYVLAPENSIGGNRTGSRKILQMFTPYLRMSYCHSSGTSQKSLSENSYRPSLHIAENPTGRAAPKILQAFILYGSKYLQRCTRHLREKHARTGLQAFTQHLAQCLRCLTRHLKEERPRKSNRKIDRLSLINATGIFTAPRRRNPAGVHAASQIYLL